MSFGKRPSSAGNPCVLLTAEHQDACLIPAEAWTGRTGEMLRALGMDPGDEVGLIPYRRSQAERLQQGRLALEARTLKVNIDVAQRVRRGAVRPFLLIPDDCWNGPIGDCLMLRLALYPHEDWNVVFLPSDMRTAVALDAPPYRNAPTARFEKSAVDFLGKEHCKLREAYALAMATRDFTAFGNARDQIRHRVKALAGFHAAQLADLWRRTRRTGALPSV